MGILDIFKRKAARGPGQSSPVPAGSDSANSKQVLPPAFNIELPRGWLELSNPGGPVTYAPRPDDSAGVLQVSRMPDRDYAYIAARERLGPFAAELGARLGWGTARRDKDSACAMGRMGLAVFEAEQFPVVLLFVTVSSSSAYMWTWLGPSPHAAEIELALQVVADAKEATLPKSRELAEFIDALNKVSLARKAILDGSSAEQLHLAVFMDPEGKVSGDDRPVLSGRFSTLGRQDRSPGERGVLMHCRFDADQAQSFMVSVCIENGAEQAEFVDRPTGAEKGLGEPGKVTVHVIRAENAPPSQAARVCVAQLWSLVGERSDVPYQSAAFEAAALGTQLVRTRVPAKFGNPGKGTWVLLKTMHPDELYVAFDLDAGIIEFFPKTPMQPNDAARALFRAL
jgi:hypothetical protein